LAAHKPSLNPSASLRINKLGEKKAYRYFGDDMTLRGNEEAEPRRRKAMQEYIEKWFEKEWVFPCASLSTLALTFSAISCWSGLINLLNQGRLTHFGFYFFMGTGIVVFLGSWLLTVTIYVKVVLRDCQPKPKPRLVVWTHNGDTMLTPKEDYEPALETRERFAFAYGVPKNTVLYVHPQLYTIFSDRVNERGRHYFPMTAFRRLAEGCVVEQCAMYIPRKYGAEFLPPQAMWKLIHGTEAPADLV